MTFGFPRPLTIFIVLLVAIATGADAQAATPPQLLNKTVAVSWVVRNVLKADSGRIVSPSVNSQRLIYISSTGRAFVRAQFQSTRRSVKRDYAPGDGTPLGRGREVRFEGGKLVTSSEFNSGAIHITVSFDGSFSSCSVEVFYGRQGGAHVRRRGMDGVMYEILESNISGQSCSIRDGNAFAG